MKYCLIRDKVELKLSCATIIQIVLQLEKHINVLIKYSVHEVVYSNIPSLVGIEFDILFNQKLIAACNKQIKIVETINAMNRYLRLPAYMWNPYSRSMQHHKFFFPYHFRVIDNKQVVN